MKKLSICLVYALGSLAVFATAFAIYKTVLTIINYYQL